MQTETPTTDEFSHTDADGQPQPSSVYKKVTKGQEIDVHTVLVPKSTRISMQPAAKERFIVLSMGTVVVKQDDAQDVFRAPAHFLLPTNKPVDIITLEDSVCYGINRHDQNFVMLDAESSKIEHFFTQGLYARKMIVPAGTNVPTHRHVYDHLSILAQGRVRVSVGPVTKEYVAPAMIEIKKNIVHTISAVEDSVWFCIHATDATDVESLESTAIIKD
jgi:quercetin dioxygenase-like cupin family protein